MTFDVAPDEIIGLTPRQVSKIKPRDIADLPIDLLSDEALGKLNAKQLSFASKESLGFLDRSQIEAFDVRAMRGLDAEQIASFAVVKFVKLPTIISSK